MARLLQVSDSHLSANAPEASANWEAVLEYVDRTRPDLVVHTGDISLNGSDDLDDLRFARQALEAITVPWLVIPGNHDIGDIGGHQYAFNAERRANFESVFGDRFWSTDLDGWKLVGVDVQALLVEDDRERWWSWLADELGSSRPTVLFVHRPLKPLAPGEVDDPIRYVIEPHRARLEALLSEGEVDVIASGHVHQARQVTVDDVQHVWAPSTWALVPDSIQPVIGTKIIGVVEHVFDDTGARSEIVVPPGMSQFMSGVHFASPYSD